MLGNYRPNYAFKKLALTSFYASIWEVFNNAKFVITVCSGSAKKPITFGSILLVEKVVMNENVNFKSFQFQK